MHIYIIASAIIIILGTGYALYGRFLTKRFKLDDSRPTPACTMTDGVDYVPARKSLLLGQHFSAIAAAGPIVGPILAGKMFGWAPALIWILIGSIFIGGVHDFSSLIASVRHKAKSIGEVVKEHLPRRVYLLFLLFIWLTIIYVIIAFTDITSQTFKTVLDPKYGGAGAGPGVAISSVIYLILGIIMGLCLYKTKLPLWAATVIFLPLVFLSIWIGPRMPEGILQTFSGISVKQWDVILLLYCFIASVIPAWLLLQPRGYLGGLFLYLVIAISLIGVFCGGYMVNYPAFKLTGISSIFTDAKPLFPILFITVACGACSGFHAIVSSGTTSKQICRESDTRVIGYGGMLLEALVAFLALSTVMILDAKSPSLGKDPNIIYATGIANFLGLLGINETHAMGFALLAFSTFVYDTLDVCTRLGRMILQELTGWQGKYSHYAATFITLLIPLAFLLTTREKSYLVAWPVFGTSNQLLASLTLLMVSVWLMQTGKSALYAIIPMAFMMLTTLWSLILLIKPLSAVINGTLAPDKVTDTAITGVAAVVLFALAVWLIVETFNVLLFRRKMQYEK